MGATTVRSAVDESMTVSTIAAQRTVTLSAMTVVFPASVKRLATTSAAKGSAYVLLRALLKEGHVGWSLNVKGISTMLVKLAMVNDHVRGRKGLGLKMDDVVDMSVVGINIATTINNNIGIIIVVVFNETIL